MKGIILAAGLGTRLYPVTHPISKILLPVYDRPMIYCPLAILMEMHIREILVITSERDKGNFMNTLGDGSRFGLDIRYDVQKVQCGIPDAFNIAEGFLDGDDAALVLGDNIVHSDGISGIMDRAAKDFDGATIFGYRVPDPERFGVIEFDADMNVLSLEEKPAHPKSDTIAIGIYLFDNTACKRVKSLKPSARGELEVLDLCRSYLDEGRLSVRMLDDDTAWFDAGTFDSLLETSNYIKAKEEAGEPVLCPELIAVRNGFVSRSDMLESLEGRKSPYYMRVIEALKK